MDIIALFLSVIGIVLNAKKIIWCWLVWIISNIFWIVYMIGRDEISSVILWIVFTIFNIYGWYEWKKINK